MNEQSLSNSEYLFWHTVVSIPLVLLVWFIATMATHALLFFMDWVDMGHKGYWSELTRSLLSGVGGGYLSVYVVMNWLPRANVNWALGFLIAIVSLFLIVDPIYFALSPDYISQSFNSSWREELLKFVTGVATVITACNARSAYS